MLDFVELRIDAANVEAALAEGVAEAMANVNPRVTNFNTKSEVNASAPKDGQETQTRKKRKRKSKKRSSAIALPSPPVTTLVCVRR